MIFAPGLCGIGRLGAGVGRISAIVIAMLAGPIHACQCAFPPLDTDSVRDATSIFVFRLVSAGLEVDGSDQPLSAAVLGEIRIVDEIRGVAKAQRIRYSTHQCCGTRLDIGKYYVAFNSEDGPEFYGHNGNLIEVGEMYYPEHETRERIEAVLAGSKRLEDVFSEYALDRTSQIPRPPAPYCPDRIAGASQRRSTE